MLADEFVPDISGFIGDCFAYFAFTVVADEHGEGAFDQVVAGEHGTKGVALSRFTGLAAGEAVGDVVVCIRIVAQLFLTQFHISVVVHEIKHSHAGLLGVFFIHLLAALETHGKFEYALVAYIGLIDDMHTGVT